MRTPLSLNDETELLDLRRRVSSVVTESCTDELGGDY